MSLVATKEEGERWVASAWRMSVGRLRMSGGDGCAGGTSRGCEQLVVVRRA